MNGRPIGRPFMRTARERLALSEYRTRIDALRRGRRRLRRSAMSRGRWGPAGSRPGRRKDVKIDSRSWAVALAVLTCSLAPAIVEAQGLSESTGVAQYFNNCARCHESTEAHKAPRTAVLKKMTPEHIYDVLTTGSMRTAAANLTRPGQALDRRVGRRPQDRRRCGRRRRDVPEPLREPPAGAIAQRARLERVGRRCRRTPALRPRATAGLSPGQVSRLALKWAFGFPGATALYGQTVIDGHLYVTSNAGYVYSLDADTGCVHWSFRSQAVVRSGFSVGRLSRTRRSPGASSSATSTAWSTRSTRRPAM